MFLLALALIGILIFLKFRPIWFPISYENYRDYSSNIGTYVDFGDGVESHFIKYINLRNGNIKDFYFYNAGFLNDETFEIIRVLATKRYNAYLSDDLRKSLGLPKVRSAKDDNNRGF